MVRKQWSKSDIKNFMSKFELAKELMNKKSSVYEDNNILFIDNKPFFFRPEGSDWIPTLQLILNHNNILPKVTVDKGAIRFVVNGADIMRPGITKCEEFSANSFIVIVDENFSKPLAIGKALFSSEEIMSKEGGKVVQNLHFIGDDIWKSHS